MVGAARFELTTSCAQGSPAALEQVARHGTPSLSLVRTRSSSSGDSPVLAPGGTLTRPLGPPVVRPLGAGRVGRVLTVKEVAAALGVCTATVYKLCSRGELSCFRAINSVRVREADLMAFMNREPGK